MLPLSALHITISSQIIRFSKVFDSFLVRFIVGFLCSPNDPVNKFLKLSKNVDWYDESAWVPRFYMCSLFKLSFFFPPKCVPNFLFLSMATSVNKLLLLFTNYFEGMNFKL